MRGKEILHITSPDYGTNIDRKVRVWIIEKRKIPKRDVQRWPLVLTVPHFYDSRPIGKPIIARPSRFESVSDHLARAWILIRIRPNPAVHRKLGRAIEERHCEESKRGKGWIILRDDCLNPRIERAEAVHERFGGPGAHHAACIRSIRGLASARD